MPFEANDVQLEFVRIDPFVRKNLGHKSKLLSQSYTSVTLSGGNIGRLIYKHSKWTLWGKKFMHDGAQKETITEFQLVCSGFVNAESNRYCLVILQLWVVKGKIWMDFQHKTFKYNNDG